MATLVKDLSDPCASSRQGSSLPARPRGVASHSHIGSDRLWELHGRSTVTAKDNRLAGRQLFILWRAQLRARVDILSREIEMSTRELGVKQNRIAESIASQYGISKDMVLFPYTNDPERPWITYRGLMSIAVHDPEIREITERFQQYIPELEQVVHLARLTLESGLTIELSGAAKMGEKIPGEEAEADEHLLSSARAIRRVLASVGKDPLSKTNAPLAMSDAEAAGRRADLAQIHILAEEKG